MQQRSQDYAFVVVAVLGQNDLSESTWNTEDEARRQRERLIKLGVCASSVRVYRTRLVKARPGLP